MAGGRLTLSGALQRGMRRALIEMSCGGRLRRNRRSVLAQVRRLIDPRPLVRTVHLLVALPVVDFALIAALAATSASAVDVPLAVCGLLVVHSSFYALRASPWYAVAPTVSSVFDRVIGGLSGFFGTSRGVVVAFLSASAWFLRLYAVLVLGI